MDGLLVIESRQPSRPVHGASSVVMTRTDTWHKKVISSRLFKTHATLWPPHSLVLYCRSTRLFLMNGGASKHLWLEVLRYKKTCQFVVSVVKIVFSMIVLNLFSTMMSELSLVIKAVDR